MTVVVPLRDFRPAARWDNKPFTQARIEEAPAADGPWTALETITLDPVDANPANPQKRNFNTELGTALNYWYRVVFLDADGDVSSPTNPIQHTAPASTTRDLCAIADVCRYVPGYSPIEETDLTLAALITAESEAIHQETGRELIANGSQPATRDFTLSVVHCRTRKVEIGDLASAGDTDIVVETVTVDGATTTAIDREAFRALYDVGRRWQRFPWEPIVELEFPSARGAALTAGASLVVTGNFGFPTVPPFIVEACAKRVILRYASDVAQAGTQLANALAEINLAGLFASARDDVDRIKRKVMIA